MRRGPSLQGSCGLGANSHVEARAPRPADKVGTIAVGAADRDPPVGVGLVARRRIAAGIAARAITTRSIVPTRYGLTHLRARFKSNDMSLLNRKRLKPEARRQEILEAGYRLFGQRGYHETSVSDIAKELGMSHGTFYRHFENKLDLFQHIIGDVLERIRVLLAPEDPEGPDSLEEYEALARRLGDRLYEAFAADPHLSQLLFIEAVGINAELNQRIQQAFELAGSFGEEYLANGVKKGFFRSDIDTKRVALAINAMALEAGRWAQRAGDTQAEQEQWIDTIVGLIVRGIGN